MYRWDTAGAERFKGVTTTYFRGANGKAYAFSIIVFDKSAGKNLCNLESLLVSFDAVLLAF